MRPLTITVFQFNPHVGNIDANTQRIINAINESQSNGTDLFITSELAITGYPPEDLLFCKSFKRQISNSLELIRTASRIMVIVGAPRYTENGSIYNSAFIFSDYQLIACYDKQYLPNYGVFDEQRYFTAGTNSLTINCKGNKLGLLICEDIWHDEPMGRLKQCDCVIVMNASPYHVNKHEQRVELIQRHVHNHKKPILYINQVGGQDDLVFDGASFAINTNTEIIQLASFKESLVCLQFVNNKFNFDSHVAYPDRLEAIYNALVLAARDYIMKNGFKGALLGLSGGIDSALTLAILVDAIGHDKVMAVMMPSQYTQDISIIDSRDMVKRLNVRYEEIDIQPIFERFLQSLKPLFNDFVADITEENLQARTRGTLLMAISNKFGYLVVTTGNKSEMTTGYATLYGDMAGGFALLKDVPKTLVYELSNWRNMKQEIIPMRIITRPPSAELRENQFDQDSLPEYDILDKITDYLVVDKLGVIDIINLGFKEDDVRKVNRLLRLNEYKRRQAAIGPKITQCGYTKDRRYPVTNGFLNE